MIRTMMAMVAVLAVCGCGAQGVILQSVTPELIRADVECDAAIGLRWLGVPILVEALAGASVGDGAGAEVCVTIADTRYCAGADEVAP